MNTLKHYSFDLWFTLIKSNPQFKKERALLFYHRFNSLKKTIIEIEAIFRTVDILCNAINEKTGNNISAEEMYLMVLYQINENNNCFDGINLFELYNELELLLFNYSPTLFCNETKNIVKKIKSKQGITTSILSNTAFVKGRSLKKILHYLEIDIYFDFQIYSDEVNLSKPNIKLYDLLFDNIIEFRKNDNIKLTEVLHIGDNINADINGAMNKGFKAFQINSNNKLITDIP